MFSDQKRDRLSESRADDIVMAFGRPQTQGTGRHIADLNNLLVLAPDITTKGHPTRFGSVLLATTTGALAGTFSQQLGRRQDRASAGKDFALGRVTGGHWATGKMDHEGLFWHNADFMRRSASASDPSFAGQRARGSS